ncbi:MAG: hypothetical protein AB7N76_23145 [Planctomycetota bacterium]
MPDAPLPPHYRTAIRRFVRFGAVGMAVGMLLGLIWTELNKSVRYAPPAAEARRVEEEGPSGRTKVRLELPPGVRWEAALSFKLSHGHAILITGVIPLLFGLGLFLAHACGGREIQASALSASFWLYAFGAVGAVGLLLYKGVASFAAIRAGNFDLAAIEAGLFAGSKAIKGICYGLSHSCMAAGAYVFLYQLYRAVGPIAAELPGAPPPPT